MKLCTGAPSKHVYTALDNGNKSSWCCDNWTLIIYGQKAVYCAKSVMESDMQYKTVLFVILTNADKHSAVIHWDNE